MKSSAAYLGLPLEQIETPALIVDLPVMESNLRRMAEFLAGHPVRLRPHAKIHRATAEIARRQIQAGAVGITCAKLNEAESLCEVGIRDILIANQVVGPGKVQRLVELAAKCDLKVAVDDLNNAQAISQLASQQGVKVGVLVEVNIGHNRCGVAPLQPALELVRHILHMPGLDFKGLMGYDGHCTLKVKAEERGELSRKANRLLADSRRYIEEQGIAVPIVSAAGTFTYRYAVEIAGISEVQAGTYLLMDQTFREHGVTEFDCALSVLATVSSQPAYPGAETLAIVDLGRKSIDTAQGLPDVKRPGGCKTISLSDEHGRISFAGAEHPLKVGDLVEFQVRDANATINLFDRFYAVREGVVEDVWPIPRCGDHT